ncbi:hypothetical protein ACJX0J_010820, partial [Zea mays]
ESLIVSFQWHAFIISSIILLLPHFRYIFKEQSSETGIAFSQGDMDLKQHYL